MSSAKRRENRRKTRGQFFLEQDKAKREALLESETVVFEIEVKMSKPTVDFARQSIYGLEGDEAHDALMQLLLNKVIHKPLRDFEVTGWGFKDVKT